jgi:biopolymer transport protein TolR
MKVDSQSSGKYRVMAEINMVPLIDVSLVLLIIFMIMTPLLVQSKIELDLPQSSTGESIPDRTNPKILTIQVAPDGTVYVSDVKMTLDQLDAKLKAIKNKKEQIVSVESDKEVAFQEFIKVMDCVRNAGLSNLRIAVKEEKRNRR